jgi:TM2 domain-containing membrane protein YozV
MNKTENQDKVTMLIVCFLLGSFGVHRYMMGYKNWWMQLALTLICGIGSIWALIDLIRIATGDMGMEDGRKLLK